MKLLDFFLERHNSYSVTVSVVVPLHNLLTKLTVDKGVAMRLLMCLKDYELVYRSYRQDSLDENATKMSMTISKRKLHGFTDQPQKTPAIIISSMEVGEARRIMEITTKERA